MTLAPQRIAWPGRPPPPINVHSKKRVTAPCDECGQETNRVRRDDRPFICADCSAVRVIDAARQMANKSGPVYDRWLSSRGPSGRPRNQEG